jgi:hypothetical protein
LLRGDAKPGRFKAFSSSPGEVFVSGDYESATDNLNSHLQLVIMSELLAKSECVPTGIRAHALSTYSSLLSDDRDSDLVFEQARGQLMGQLTSFPLLCLVNYLVFKYYVRRDVPVKINGDDIVFRATETEYQRWSEGVVRGGLTLSKGKTLVSRRFFSLNSVLFDGNGSVSFVGFARANTIWTDKDRLCERISSLRSRFRALTVGMGRERSTVFRRIFLRANHDGIQACRRSLTRGMGMNVRRVELESAGLWFRELFYLEQVQEPPLPFFSFSEMRGGAIPEGWTRVSPRFVEPEVVRGWKFRLAAEFVRGAWEKPVVSDRDAEKRWMSACDNGVSRWGVFTSKAPLARMLRLSRRDFWKFVYLRRDDRVWGRRSFTIGKGVLKPPCGTYAKDVALVWCRCGRPCGEDGSGNFHESTGDCGRSPRVPVAFLEWNGPNYRAVAPPLHW